MRDANKNATETAYPPYVIGGTERRTALQFALSDG